MRWSAVARDLIQRPSLRRIPAPAIIVAAFVLRLIRLGNANLWWDEALAAWAVRQGLAGVTVWTAADVHPPLYFWSLWGWVQVAGDSEFALRFLSVVLGVLTVAAVYRLGLLVGGRSTAALGGLLVALSRFHIWWSQETRMYVLAGLLGTLSVGFFMRWLRAMRREPPAGDWHPGLLLAGYVLTTLGALYTVYLSAAWIVVQNAVVLGALLSPRAFDRRRLVGRWALAQGLVLAGLGVWLAFSWGRMRSWSVAGPASPAFVLRLYATLLTSGVSVEIDRYLWALALPLAALAAGLVLLVRQALRDADATRRFDLATLVLCVLVPPVLVYLSAMPRSLFYTPRVEARYFLPFAPAFWVLLAWGVVAIGKLRRPLGVAISAGLLIAWAAVLPPYYAGRQLDDDLQTMTRAIVSQGAPNDAVLLNSGSRYPLFLYQYDRIEAASRPAFVTISRTDDALQPEDIVSWLDAAVTHYDRIWLAEVDANLADPGGLVRQALAERFPVVWSEGYGANALYLYTAGEHAVTVAQGYVPDREAPDDLKALGLRGWDVPVEAFSPGEPLWLTLYWDRPPDAPVTVELVNAQGVALASRAAGAGPLTTPVRERLEFAITDAFFPGPYDLVLEAGGKAHTLEGIGVEGVPDTALAGGIAVPTDVSFGDGIRLEGYALGGHADATEPLVIEPGGDIVLDLYWRADAKPETGWTVFTHLVGDAFNPATQGPLWGQHDAVPGGGLWPTRQWRARDAGIDRHRITVDANAPQGFYMLAVGLYDAAGIRAQATRGGESAGDALTLDVQIEVRAP